MNIPNLGPAGGRVIQAKLQVNTAGEGAAAVLQLSLISDGVGSRNQTGQAREGNQNQKSQKHEPLFRRENKMIKQQA